MRKINCFLVAALIALVPGMTIAENKNPGEKISPEDVKRDNQQAVGTTADYL